MRAAFTLAVLTACGDAGDDRGRCVGEGPLVLDVAIDPALAAPDDARLACEGDLQRADEVCSSTPDVVAWFDDRLVVDLAYVGLVGWYPRIAIAGDGSAARVCSVHYSDVAIRQCPAAVCAAAGTVTLSRLPAGRDDEPLTIAIDVAFPGGGAMRGTFDAEWIDR